MSDEQGLSRLLKRGKRRTVLAGDVRQVEAMVELLRQSGKARRGAALSSSRTTVDLDLRKAQHKRGRPIGE